MQRIITETVTRRRLCEVILKVSVATDPKEEELSVAVSQGTPRHLLQRPVDVDHLLDHLLDHLIITHAP